MQEEGPTNSVSAIQKALRIFSCMAVAALAVAQTGCLVVAAGAAAGAAATGYVYYKGRLYRDYPAGVADALAATRAGLLDLQFPLVSEETKDGSACVSSRTADGTAVRIWLDMVPSRVPADGSMTRISVRVGAFGDEAVSARILDQIVMHLVPPALVRPQASVAPGLAEPAIQPVRALMPGETSPPPLAK
jgi:hypothetical protein